MSTNDAVAAFGYWLGRLVDCVITYGVVPVLALLVLRPVFPWYWKIDK